MKIVEGTRAALPKLLDDNIFYICTDTKQRFIGTPVGNIEFPVATEPFEVLYFAPQHPEGEDPIMNIIYTNSTRQFNLINAGVGRYALAWTGEDVYTVMFQASTTNSAFMKIEADACNRYTETGRVLGIDFDCKNDFEGPKNLIDSTSVVVIKVTLFTRLTY